MLKRIQVNQLTTGMFVSRFDDSWLNHPFWRTRFLVADQETLNRIQASGVLHCWIDTTQGTDVLPASSPDLLQPAPEATAGPNATSHAPVVALSEELHQAARLRARSAQVMRTIFADARLGNISGTTECVALVDGVVESINRQPHALLSLLRLKDGDEYTYLHSVAVCTLMVALARQLNLTDSQCRDAGMAGMMHDLGKAATPQEILNKPGKLSPAEFDIIKQHPRRGYEMLLKAGNISEPVKDVCLHHHERIDGTGYPDGLTGEQISLYARMGAVCDVYDALTSDRPYKEGWDPAQAIAQMATWQGHFDPVIFQSFVKSIGIYPTGSLVRMRSGKLAVVLEQHPTHLTKPRVKVFFSIKAGGPIEPRVIDLSSSGAQDQIEARESPERWNFSYLTELWDGDAALKKARA